MFLSRYSFNNDFISAIFYLLAFSIIKIPYLIAAYNRKNTSVVIASTATYNCAITYINSSK